MDVVAGHGRASQAQRTAAPGRRAEGRGEDGSGFRPHWHRHRVSLVAARDWHVVERSVVPCRHSLSGAGGGGHQ